MDEAAQWVKVGEAVRARRLYLGLPQGAGGVSSATWRKIESAVGWPYLASTLAKVCRALMWTPDSIDRLLRGQDVVESDDAAPTPDALAATLERIEDRLGRIEERLDDISERDPL